MLLVALTTGCIKEDLDSCDTNLIFRYFGDGTKDIFPEKIEKVDLYVYSENGALVETIGLNQGDLRNNQGPPSTSRPANTGSLVGVTPRTIPRSIRLRH